MSKYPIWWDTTLTIYNKFQDTQTQLVKWYRTTVSGCFWKYVGDKISINNTTLETNNIICRIPKQDNFLEKHLWINTPNDTMSDFFTLGTGDIIVKGEVDDEIDEYTSKKRSTDLVAKYKALQGCMQIEEVAINVGAGRCNEHYYVKGI
jgi:pentose-5-phosphate-3-epimerase